MSKIISGFLILFLLFFVSSFANNMGTIKDKVVNSAKEMHSALQKIKIRDTMPKVYDLRLKSSGFIDKEFIPSIYTCDSIDISPSLDFGILPEHAKSLALICYDPDAPGGTWVHWVIFNLPSRHLTLPENIEKVLRPEIGQDSTDIQPIQGINDFGEIGYGGPCPPVGPAHRYFFTLYALDTVLEFDEEEIQKGITKDMLLKAMEGHILAESVLMGKYKR